MDKKEDAAELKDVAKMDAVNEDSKAAMAEMLAGKMAKQKMDNKDAEEEAAELKDVAAMDAVNEDSKAALEDKLAGKMQKQKMDNMDAKEEAAELKEVAAMDAVNEDSKAAMADILAKKAAAKKEEEEEVEAAASPALSPPVDGAEEYSKKKAIYINKKVEAALDKLYSNDKTHHVIFKTGPKKKGKKRNYAELVSTGEDVMAPMLTTIESDPNQVYFFAFQVDTSDASGSNRTKYGWSQYMGVTGMAASKVMSYLGEVKALCKKEDVTLQSVDKTNYKAEYTKEKVSEALNKRGSHKPDKYSYGSMGDYQMEK